MENKYLLPEPDGLPARESQDYVYYKLKAISTYLKITNTAMHSKPWYARYYIDLQAGPGKNQIGNKFELGSPLIALTSEYPPTYFRFNELDLELRSALEQRVSASPIRDRVKIYGGDVNEVVHAVCDEIQAMDKEATANKQWSTLNVAFLDPNWLELHWTTVARLASMKRMDLIINFSTQGVIRSIGSKKFDTVNLFFGTDEWRQIDDPNTEPTVRRRALIDFYRKRLISFGYHIEIDPDLGGDDIAVNNSKNSQVYSLIFASKNELGDRFWKHTAKSVKPPRLPGFDF